MSVGPSHILTLPLRSDYVAPSLVALCMHSYKKNTCKKLQEYMVPLNNFKPK